MNGVYIFLILLAAFLFSMGIIVSIIQKRMMQVNFDNTLSINNNIDVVKTNKIDDSVENDLRIKVSKQKKVLKHCDTEEMLDFIDEEIL